MATLYGSNYTSAYNTVPASAIGVGDLSGKVRMLYDSITFSSNVNAINDIIKIGKLPVGAKVIQAVVSCPSLGTTGILDFGWAASSSGNIAADANGFISGADAGGQAVFASFGTAAVGNGAGKEFAESVDVQLVFTEASDAASGKELKAWVLYVLE